VYIDLFHTVDERLVEALQEGCSCWAPGIEIIAVRITKPKIPPQIAANYEDMEAQKTKLLVATQAQKVSEKAAETEKKVSSIRQEQLLAEKENKKTMSQIEDQTHLNHEKAFADAGYYKALKEAESNKVKYTKEFLQLELIRSLSNNTKIYFGQNINSMFLDFFNDLIAKTNPVVSPSSPPTK